MTHIVAFLVGAVGGALAMGSLCNAKISLLSAAHSQQLAAQQAATAVVASQEDEALRAFTELVQSDAAKLAADTQARQAAIAAQLDSVVLPALPQGNQ